MSPSEIESRCFQRRTDSDHAPGHAHLDNQFGPGGRTINSALIIRLAEHKLWPHVSGISFRLTVKPMKDFPDIKHIPSEEVTATFAAEEKTG